MPYISVRVAGELSMEQKRMIADEFSETMLKVAGKPKSACYIVFDEVSRDNWAKGSDILGDVDRANAKKDQ